MAKKRSATMPTKNGAIMPAMAETAYTEPICGSLKSWLCKYVPMVTYHEPQVKYCKNIIIDSRVRIPISIGTIPTSGADGTAG